MGRGKQRGADTPPHTVCGPAPARPGERPGHCPASGRATATPERPTSSLLRSTQTGARTAEKATGPERRVKPKPPRHWARERAVPAAADGKVPHRSGSCSPGRAQGGHTVPEQLQLRVGVQGAASPRRAPGPSSARQPLQDRPFPMRLCRETGREATAKRPRQQASRGALRKLLQSTRPRSLT